MGKSISKQRCVLLNVFMKDCYKTNLYSTWLHNYEKVHERDVTWLKYLSHKLNKHYYKKFGFKYTSEKEIKLYEIHTQTHL